MMAGAGSARRGGGPGSRAAAARGRSRLALDLQVVPAEIQVHIEPALRWKPGGLVDDGRQQPRRQAALAVPQDRHAQVTTRQQRGEATVRSEEHTSELQSRA